MAEIKKVDAMGDACPIPVIKAKKALDAAVAGDILEVHVDNEIAIENLKRLAAGRQCGFEMKILEEHHFAACITVTEHTGKTVTEAGKAGAQTPENRSEASDFGFELENCNCQMPQKKHTIAVISSATMGTGNDELGKVLMKGFLYALSQLDEPPEKILFYNGGVTLTTEGSDSLEDLKTMEEQGVEIYSCGTCLDYYGLKEQLKVGEVTNMYSIVEAMAEAGKIIRP